MYICKYLNFKSYELKNLETYLSLPSRSPWFIPSVSWCLYLSKSFQIYLSIYQKIHIYLSIYLSIWKFISTISIYLSIYLSRIPVFFIVLPHASIFSPLAWDSIWSWQIQHWRSGKFWIDRKNGKHYHDNYPLYRCSFRLQSISASGDQYLVI